MENQNEIIQPEVIQPEVIQPEIKHKLVKKYKNKNGEEVIKVYDQQKYNSKFYQKHKEKINEIYECELCKKNVKRANKFNHERTNLHIGNKMKIPPPTK
jgi:hypothetical protein